MIVFTKNIVVGLLLVLIFIGLNGCASSGSDSGPNATREFDSVADPDDDPELGPDHGPGRGGGGGAGP